MSRVLEYLSEFCILWPGSEGTQMDTAALGCAQCALLECLHEQHSSCNLASEMTQDYIIELLEKC